MSKPNDPSPPKKGRTPQTYSPEFKAAAAKLVTSEGRSPAQVAKDLGISGSMIGRWVADARRGGPRPPAPLSATEREEFDRLRWENRVLKMAREILKKPQPSSPRRTREVRVHLRVEGDLADPAMARVLDVSKSGYAAAVPAPNLLDRDFTASKPNERWVGDVTYLRTPAGWLYLAAVMDLFSRRIVGWAISPYNDRKLAKAGLSDALRRRRPGPGYLHHTDRGSPYTSDDYQRLLDDSGALCSMSRKGNCLDNAAMESWFATLKAELGETFGSFADARRQLFDFIEVFYNRQRRHSSLGYLSPAEFEAVGAP